MTDLTATPPETNVVGMHVHPHESHDTGLDGPARDEVNGRRDHVVGRETPWTELPSLPTRDEPNGSRRAAVETAVTAARDERADLLHNRPRRPDAVRV